MLDKVLREKTALIPDQNLRKHYDDALYQLKRELFFQPRAKQQQGQWRGFQKPATSNPETKVSFLAAAEDRDQEILHEAVLLAVLIKVPEIIVDFEDALENADLHTDVHHRLRSILLQYGHNGSDVLEAEISQQLGDDALAKLLSAPHVAVVPALRRTSDHELARMTIEAEFAKLQATRGHRQELAEAMEDMTDRPTEAVTHRVKEATEARNRAERNQQEDKAEYDLGPNGAPINREERNAFDELLGKIPFTKSRH